MVKAKSTILQADRFLLLRTQNYSFLVRRGGGLSCFFFIFFYFLLFFFWRGTSPSVGCLQSNTCKTCCPEHHRGSLPLLSMDTQF